MTKNTSAARFWSLSPLGPAASSPVGLESLGPSPPRPAAQGTDGEGTRPTGRARGVFPVHPIGVGMVVAGHPSLRTGLADVPHPALHPAPPRLAAQGTDGETPSLPNCQTAMPRAGRQRGNQRRGEGRTAQQSGKQRNEDSGKSSSGLWGDTRITPPKPAGPSPHGDESGDGLTIPS